MVVIYDTSILLNVIGLGQCLFLVFSFYKSSTQRKENIYLSLLFAALSVLLINTIFRLSYYRDVLSWFEGFSNGFLLLVAPSVYLFVLHKINRKSRLHIGLHYLPFALYEAFKACAIFIDFLKPFEAMIGGLAFITFNIQFLVYFILSIQLIRQNISTFSSLKSIRTGIYLMIIPWLLQHGFILTELVFHYDLPEYITLNGSLVFTVFAFYLSYLHHNKRQAFQIGDKYEKSNLTSTEANQIYSQLNSLMQAEELFKEQQLSLQMLASRLTTSQKKISQTINQKTGGNLKDYINKYRIDALLKLLATDAAKQYTMIALAEQCGFKSSSGFYKAFQNQTGLTPSQYLKQTNA